MVCLQVTCCLLTSTSLADVNTIFPSPNGARGTQQICGSQRYLIGTGLREHLSYKCFTAGADDFDHPANRTPGKQLLATGTAQGHQHFSVSAAIPEETMKFSLELMFLP